MSIKSAMAAGMLLEKQKKETVDSMAMSLATNFSLLANIEPMVAIHVLEQLNEQFDRETAEEMAQSQKDFVKNMAKKMNITTDHLEEEEEE